MEIRNKLQLKNQVYRISSLDRKRKRMQKQQKTRTLSARTKTPSILKHSKKRSTSYLKTDVTSMTPMSMRLLRSSENKHTQMKRIVSIQGVPQKGTKLQHKVLEAFEDWETLNDVGVDMSEYTKFIDDFSKLVFDKHGRYLYTRQQIKSYDQLDLANKIEVKNQSAYDKFNNKLQDKYIKKDMLQVLDNLEKHAGKTSKQKIVNQQQPLCKYIKGIKKKQLEKLMQLKKERKTSKIIQKCDHYIKKCNSEAQIGMKSLYIKVGNLNKIIQKQAREIQELKYTLQGFKQKDIMQIDHMKKVQEKATKVGKENLQLSAFKKIFQIYQQKLDLGNCLEEMKVKLLEVLDNYLDQQAEILRLNEETLVSQDKVKQVKQSYQNKYNRLENKIVNQRYELSEQIKQSKRLQYQIFDLQRQITLKNEFKDKYIGLFKQVVDQYFKWISQNDIYGSNIEAKVKQLEIRKKHLGSESNAVERQHIADLTKIVNVGYNLKQSDLKIIKRMQDSLVVKDGKIDIKIMPNFDNYSDLLKIMDRTISIKTSEKYQKYLRNIIVYANQLQRNHFPEYVNERYDPEKIYKRIEIRMDKMKRTIQKLTNQTDELKDELVEKEKEILVMKNEERDQKQQKRTLMGTMMKSQARKLKNKTAPNEISISIAKSSRIHTQQSDNNSLGKNEKNKSVVKKVKLKLQ